MLERQDLDALLVGALYGELSSADEARLTAHLDSHPADRSALDDLKSAHQTVRQKVATSRIFELQLDPPQHLSALLLQEAARRAPKVVSEKTRESWFQRFVHSFIAHPAMAAAATLVLVVGVGSMIYLKKGQPQLAEPTVAQNTDRAPAASDTPSSGIAAGSSAESTVATGKAVGGIGGNDSVAVTLDDGTNAQGEGRGGKGKDQAALAQEAQTKVARDRGDAFGLADDAKRAQATRPSTTPAKQTAPKAYVEVPREEPQPKDLDEVAKNDRAEKADKAGEAKPGRAFDGTGGGAAGPSAASAEAPVAQTAMPEPPPPAPKPAEADTAWAKDQHAKITALVKAGKCGDAVPVATALRSRAPAYFAANVMTDRQLKSCMQYVNDTGSERAKAERHSEPAATTKAR